MVKGLSFIGALKHEGGKLNLIFYIERQINQVPIQVEIWILPTIMPPDLPMFSYV